MAQQSKTIDESGNEVLDARKALMEQTLAVDLASAEIDRAVATAHKFPRSIDVVIKKIRTMACYNQDAAENCIYSLPRGGKPIIGPSIGFANILATAWGNCADGGRPTYTDRKEKAIFAEGVFHDWESNRRTVIHESRRIVDKHGKFYSDDMIIVTGKAAAAIARRNAILNAVPRAIWHPIYEEALRTVRGEMTTFVERKDKALKAFAQFGVTPEKVILALGLKGEPDLTLEHIPLMRGMYAALRDGTTTVEEMFDPRRMTGKGFEQVENPLGEEGGGPAAPAAAATTGAPAAVQEEQDPTAGMGEEAPPWEGNGQDAPQTAQGRPPVAQNQNPPPDQGVTQNAPAMPTEASAPKEPSPQVHANGPKEPARPTDQLREPDEYIGYWEGFLAAATSETAISGQWSADRKLRGNCRVIGPLFEEAQKMRDERIAAVKAGVA